MPLLNCYSSVRNPLPVIRQLLALLLLLFSPGLLFAQKKITGSVKDDNGKPVPGVSVSVKEKGTTTITDTTGHFKLNAETGNTVIFSSVNLEELQLKVDSRSEYNVVLKIKVKELDDVIVIGYGTQQKKDVTGSVDKVNMTDLQKAPVRSFEEALAGRIAGVQVNSSDGQPGSGINVTVRGYNSVTQNNGPLYVIDGFPIENPNNNTINPQDIESMEVLKDASATAIYGARGANGVILITTKRGKEGPAIISFSTSYGIQKIINKADMMDPYEFVKYQFEVDSVSTKLLYFKNGRTLDYYKTEPSLDWQSKVFRTAPIQSHTISVSGGSQKTRYSLSGSVFKQDGIIIASDYTRYQGRATLDQVVNNKLKVGYNLNYSYLMQTGLSPVQVSTLASSNALYSVWGSRPTTGLNNDSIANLLFDPSTDLNNDYKINPEKNISNAVRNNRTNNLTANVYMEYELVKDLKLRVTGGVSLNTFRQETFNNSNTIFGSLLTNIGKTYGVNGSLIYYENNSWLNENTLTWTKRIKQDHVFTVLAGVTEQKNVSSTYGQSATFLPNESLGTSGLDEGTPQQVTASRSLWTLASFLGRVNYSYKSKYLLTASLRSDGSSKFAPDKKWGYFPSGALAWRFTQEDFFKGLLRFVNEGKLRASYGKTGNNRISDFAYLSVITLPIGSSYVVNNNYIRGSNVTAIGNPDLKWETTEQTNLGIDLSFFKKRVNMTVDAYRKKTNDLLLYANLPLSLGYDNAFKNIGSVQNDGIELTISTVTYKSSSFTWNTSFNISFYKNKVLKLAENQNSLNSTIGWDFNYTGIPAYNTQIGQPLGLMYGYLWDGVYQYSDFNKSTNGGYVLKDNVATNGNTRSLIQPGDIKYRDINGDNVVDAQDYVVIGRGLPIHTGGFTNDFKYKNFDLSIFFQWSYGNDILNVNRMVFEGNSLNRTNLNQYASYANRWTPDNQGSDIPRAKGVPSNSPYSSRYVEDGSYIRLKTLNIGYTLPASFLKKARIREFRIWLATQNLLTWTKYSGLDPEVNTYSSVLTPGFDYSAYPRARTFTLGANISF